MKRGDFPVIRLAPWEHSVNATAKEIETPAQNVAPFEWYGQTFQIAARFADYGDGIRYLFARFIGEGDEGNWVLISGCADNFPRQYAIGQRLKLTKQLDRLKRSHYFPFGRLFYFGAHELGTVHPTLAFISTSGSGCWIPLGKENDAVMPFSVDGGISPFDLSLQQNESLRYVAARDIRARLLNVLTDANSDAYFALNWSQRDEIDRENTVLEGQGGTLEELRSLLSCIVQIEPIVQSEEGSWGLDIDDDPHWEWQFFLRPADQILERTPDSVRLRIWKRLILSHFMPRANGSLLALHVCARRWFRYRYKLLGVQIQSPTQHERLEAALFLRDWTRDKISPRKLQLLLSQV